MNPEFWVKDTRIMAFLERIGVLVKAGLLDMSLVALSFSGAINHVWEKVEPIIEQVRDKFQYPRMWSETEYLCKRLIEYMDEHSDLAP